MQAGFDPPPAIRLPTAISSGVIGGSKNLKVATVRPLPPMVSSAEYSLQPQHNALYRGLDRKIGIRPDSFDKTPLRRQRHTASHTLAPWDSISTLWLKSKQDGSRSRKRGTRQLA